MKFNYINLDKLKKTTKVVIAKTILVLPMTVLVGCSSPTGSVEPVVPTNEIIIEETTKAIELAVEVVEETKETIEVEPVEQVDERKIVALTFDDGPSKYTEELINILNENNSTATFFVIGTNVKKYNETVKYAYDSGNEIAVHGYSHTSFKDMTIEEIQNEIDTTKKLINDCGAECSNLVRPPYGSINSEIMQSIDSTFIMWNIDTRDWESRDKDKIKEEIIGKINDGDIILFHDLYGSTIEAIREVLPELSNEYRFVSVSELFRLKELEYEENNKYYKVK